jgi:hypothetical protein
MNSTLRRGDAENLAKTEARIKRERVERAAAALRSPTCVCGATKGPRMAVCRSCWDELPLRFHRGLYRLIGSGFEEAYESARIWLHAARGIG